MEKILSKEEIADLLSAVRHGEVDFEEESSVDFVTARRKSVQNFNLVRSNEPENWRLRNYDLILDSFARNYSLALSSRFQRSLQVKLEAMESMRFDVLLQRLSGRGAIGVLDLNPLVGGALLVFDEQLSFALVEIVLGGDAGNKTAVPDRSMTAIELNVLRDVIQSACLELNKGFDQLFKVDTSLQELVSNLRLLNFATSEVGVVTARFRTTIDGLEGSITLVIPHTALEPLQKKQQAKAAAATIQANSKWQTFVCDELEQMEVEVEGVLAMLNLRVRDILNFQVGDVIELNSKPDAPLKLMVENQPKFLGMPGVHDGKKAIRIMGRIPHGG